jgi:hypothetical protein
MTSIKNHSGNAQLESRNVSVKKMADPTKVNETVLSERIQNISSSTDAEIGCQSLTIQQSTGPKKIELRSPFDFLDAYYKGRVKTLSEAVIRRIKSNSIALDSESREALLQLAISEDVILDKTRKLMSIGLKLDDLKPLGELLINFAVEVICQHSKIKSNGVQAKLFPGFMDEFTLNDAWTTLEGLQKLTVVKEPSVPVVSSSSEEGGAKVGSTQKSRNGLRRSGGNLKQPSLTAERAFRNAYLCSVIWRIHKKQSTFADSMRAMRSSIFRAQSNVINEDELLEAIAQMPEKEDLKVALIWDWQVRQQTEVTSRLSFATQEIERLEAQLVTAENEKIVQLNAIYRLQQEATQSQLKIEQLIADIGVVTIHGNDDQENLRASSLRVISGAITNIENVVTALGRDPPKTGIAIEVLTVVLDGFEQVKKQLQGFNT